MDANTNYLPSNNFISSPVIRGRIKEGESHKADFPTQTIIPI
jgi:hypothetical protein